MALSCRMFIVGLGTAAPPHCYAQSEGWDVVQRAPQFELLNSRSRAILKKILTGRNGITTRHLALDNLDEAFQMDPKCFAGTFCSQCPCSGRRGRHESHA